MTTQSPSPAKPLSFHPAHTCSKCGHVTISDKAVEQSSDHLQSPPTKAEDR